MGPKGGRSLRRSPSGYQGGTSFWRFSHRILGQTDDPCGLGDGTDVHFGTADRLLPIYNGWILDLTELVERDLEELAIDDFLPESSIPME